MPYALAGAEGPWVPPGLAQPWPADEYLVDGGDKEPTATVRAEWEVAGLNMEDTIAHYDTLDGRRVVEPSNRVHLYSPRFASVRKVTSVRQSFQADPPAGVRQPVNVASHEEVRLVDTSKQNVQTVRQIGRTSLDVFRTKQGDGVMSSIVGPFAFQNDFKPFEDLLAIRLGQFREAEMAWLANGTAAAVAWEHAHAVQVILDQQAAAEGVDVQQLHSVYTVEDPPGNPKLRIIKVASTQFAEPGDTVDFTLRFDNVGDELIGNVTIIDNLTTRLEYVEGSAQCSVPGTFSTEPNEGDSLVLRWEITDPLPPQQGGIIRFTCRVR